MCDPRVSGALLFICMVAGLSWHFSNFPWLCKVFLQTILYLGGHFTAISKFGKSFGNKMGISQPIFEAWSIFVAGVDFTEEGNFHSPFCSCEIPVGALRDRLQTAITSSFQLQIMYCLKHWTPDFPSFEMRYSIHNLSSRKCSKNVSNSRKIGVRLRHFSSLFAQSSSNSHNFFVSTPNRAPFEVLDS